MTKPKKDAAQREFWADIQSSPSLVGYGFTTEEATRLQAGFRVVAGGCWSWQGAVDIGGYGIAQFRGKRVVLHRLMYRFAYADIPPRLLVMHRCDNRRCANPAHLSLGTCMENVADMMRKGRHTSMRKPKLKSARK